MSKDSPARRLVLLNGLPGSGKSTLAERVAAVRPRTAVVDVDAVRAGLRHPDPASDGAGLRAREVALGLARDHLLAGDDVLVPQFLGRLRFVEALERLAAEVGAALVEVVLATDVADVVPRLARRAAAAERPEHRLAADLLAAAGPESLQENESRLRAVVRARPATLVVRGVDGDPDATLAAVTALLDG